MIFLSEVHLNIKKIDFTLQGLQDAVLSSPVNSKEFKPFCADNSHRQGPLCLHNFSGK